MKTDTGALRCKYFLDAVVSVSALVILSPLFLLIMAGVRLSSKGSVFYTQERIGRGGVPFRIYKFRSMIEDAEKSGPQLTEKNDSRVTPIGKVLRKYHLDELPQFWNVLKGDMSVVGPRPERRYFIEKVREYIPDYEILWDVRPGITSLGMVRSGYASDVNQLVERTRHEQEYVRNMSPMLDFRILLASVRTVMKGKGQ